MNATYGGTDEQKSMEMPSAPLPWKYLHNLLRGQAEKDNLLLLEIEKRLSSELILV